MLDEVRHLALLYTDSLDCGQVRCLFGSVRSFVTLSESRILSWLGGLDSNQGSMLQRHVSYHWTTSQD